MYWDMIKNERMGKIKTNSVWSIELFITKVFFRKRLFICDIILGDFGGFGG
jgi:hypothetical protein